MHQLVWLWKEHIYNDMLQMEDVVIASWVISDTVYSILLKNY